MSNAQPFLTLRATDTSSVLRPAVVFCAERSCGTHHYRGVFGIVADGNPTAAGQAQADFLAEQWTHDVAETVSGRIVISDDCIVERLTASGWRVVG